MAVKRDKIIKSAEKYVGRGKIEAAIKEYQKLLKEQPNDINTLNRIGDLFTRIDRDDDAIRFFKQIASQYSNDGFFVKAIAIYKKIIRIDPTRLAVYEQLADLYAKQGLLNEARAQFQTLVDYYLKHGDDAAAINVYQSLVELEPENPSHHLKLADLYEKRQLHDRAQREYKTIAELMLRYERGEEAAKVFERAVEMHPEDLDFLSEAVMVLREAGFDGPAAQLLARSVELNPDAARLQGDLGTAPEPVSAEPEPDVFELDLEEEAAASTGIETDEAEALEVPEELPDLPSPEEEDEFELDLEGADLSGTVAPPADMGEDTGSAFQEAEEVEDIEDVEDLEIAEEIVSESLEAEPDLGALEDDEFEIELELEEPVAIDWDLEADGERVAPEAEPEPEAPVEAVLEPEPAAEVEEEPPRVDDLLAEADVFAKYGLGTKALERVEQVLQFDPANFDALRRRVDLLLSEDGDGHAVEGAAAAYRREALARGEEAAWREMASRLELRGFPVEEAPAPAEPPPREEIPAAEPEEPVEAEAREEPPAEIPPDAKPAPPAPGPGRKRADVDQALEDIASEILRPQRPRAAPSAKAPSEEAETLEPHAPAEPAAGEERESEEIPVAPPERADFADADFDTELPDIRLPEEFIATPADDPLDDTGMQWLDEEAPPAAAASGEEILFDDEEEFFDLAAELEEELSQEEARLGKDVLGQPEEPSLEEIVEGFKKGVAENLSEEDFATHYNLGIAYREMGLLDEAIGEFQLASKSPELLVECCSMLGITFLEKGLPELAVKWYQKGLAAPDLGEETRLGLLYDMGAAYLEAGDEDAAREAFTEIYGVNSQFRDVDDKLDELR